MNNNNNNLTSYTNKKQLSSIKERPMTSKAFTINKHSYDKNNNIINRSNLNLPYPIIPETKQSNTIVANNYNTNTNNKININSNNNKFLANKSRPLTNRTIRNSHFSLQSAKNKSNSRTKIQSSINNLNPYISNNPGFLLNNRNKIYNYSNKSNISNNNYLSNNYNGNINHLNNNDGVNSLNEIDIKKENLIYANLPGMTKVFCKVFNNENFQLKNCISSIYSIRDLSSNNNNINDNEDNNNSVFNITNVLGFCKNNKNDYSERLKNINYNLIKIKESSGKNSNTRTNSNMNKEENKNKMSKFGVSCTSNNNKNSGYANGQDAYQFLLMFEKSCSLIRKNLLKRLYYIDCSLTNKDSRNITSLHSFIKAFKLQELVIRVFLVYRNTSDKDYKYSLSFITYNVNSKQLRKITKHLKVETKHHSNNEKNILIKLKEMNLSSYISISSFNPKSIEVNMKEINKKIDNNETNDINEEDDDYNFDITNYDREINTSNNDKNDNETNENDNNTNLDLISKLNENINSNSQGNSVSYNDNNNDNGEDKDYKVINNYDNMRINTNNENITDRISTGMKETNNKVTNDKNIKEKDSSDLIENFLVNNDDIDNDNEYKAFEYEESNNAKNNNNINDIKDISKKSRPSNKLSISNKKYNDLESKRLKEITENINKVYNDSYNDDFYNNIEFDKTDNFYSSNNNNTKKSVDKDKIAEYDSLFNNNTNKKDKDTYKSNLNTKTNKKDRKISTENENRNNTIEEFSGSLVDAIDYSQL